MKRNIVPLLAIAFIVAMISTGVFYGLFAGRLRAGAQDAPKQTVVVAARNLDRGTVLADTDVRLAEVHNPKLKASFNSAAGVAGRTLVDGIRAGDPVTPEHLAPISNSGSSAVPSGMRAISVHVADSAGLFPLLHGGQKVDIQVAMERDRPTELRTILQDVEVLSVSTQPDLVQPNRNPEPVVTVLVHAEDTDVLALADSGGRIRFALRNPLDQDAEARRPLQLSAIFQNGRLASERVMAGSIRTPVEKGGAALIVPSRGDESPLPLWVRVVAVDNNRLGDLASKLIGNEEGGSPRITTVQSTDEVEQALRKLESREQAHVVSSSHVNAAANSGNTLTASGQQCHLRVRFSCENHANGSIGLRVHPELTLSRDASSETRSVDTVIDYDKTSAVLVSGLISNDQDRAALALVFPGVSWKAKQLVILVEPGASQSTAVAALRYTEAAVADARGR